MPLTRLLTVAVLLAMAGSAAAQKRGKPTPQGKQLYCWDDASGRKVCGDALPPEAADAARTVINARTGMEKGQVARALTDEERAEARAEAAEADRQAALEADRQRRELALVESYATEAELRRAYQTRIDLMVDTVKASELGVLGRRQSLLSLLRRAAELELAGKPVDKATASSIQKQHAVLRQEQALLASQRRERALLDEELVESVARYRELKKPAVPATGSTPGQ